MDGSMKGGLSVVSREECDTLGKLSLGRKKFWQSMFVVLSKQKATSSREGSTAILMLASTHAPQIGAISIRVTSSSAVSDQNSVISSGVDQDSNTSSSAVHRVHGYEVPYPHLSKGSAPASHGKLSTKPSDCVDLKLDASETRGGEKLHVMMGRRSKCYMLGSPQNQGRRELSKRAYPGVWRDLACLSKPRRFTHTLYVVGGKQCM